jgi:SAM-dependent methyltransferase
MQPVTHSKFSLHQGGSNYHPARSSDDKFRITVPRMSSIPTPPGTERHAREAFAAEHLYREQQAVYKSGSGPDARDVLISAIGKLPGGRALDIGCGEGQLAAELSRRGWTVIAQDSSRRMCQLARSKEVAVQVAALPRLPLRDQSIDCVVAAWVLHYLSSSQVVDAINEIRRVLEPRGTLFAATNSNRHMAELWSRLPAAHYQLPFSAENAVELLTSLGWTAEAVSVSGTVVFPDYQRAHSFVANQVYPRDRADRLERFEGPLTVTRRAAIVVARPEM